MRRPRPPALSLLLVSLFLLGGFGDSANRAGATAPTASATADTASRARLEPIATVTPRQTRDTRLPGGIVTLPEGFAIGMYATGLGAARFTAARPRVARREPRRQGG